MESTTAETDLTRTDAHTLAQVAPESIFQEVVVQELEDTIHATLTKRCAITGNVFEVRDIVTANQIASMDQMKCSAQIYLLLVPTPLKSTPEVTVECSVADLKNSPAKSVDSVYQRKGCVIESPIVPSRKMNKTAKLFR